MNILINFADDNFKSSQKLNTKSAYGKGGFDMVHSFSPNDIDSKY